MEDFDSSILKQLVRPDPNSHKGQNGKLLVIGGSHLFHAASLWALGIASKLVDMVFYASTPENNAMVQKAKEEFRNGIVIPRAEIDEYAKEADCILIGPGLMRSDRKISIPIQSGSNLEQINNLEDEGEQTYFLTKYLLEKYPEKKWVIDAGALQMLDPSWLKKLNGHVILTPHAEEFERVFGSVIASNAKQSHDGEIVTSQAPRNDKIVSDVAEMAKKFHCIVLLKGKEDTVCSSERCVRVHGGNAGMTRGGTGDVLAGLVAGLACKNEMYLAAQCGSYINKKAGDSLFEKVGFAYNSTDLVNEIPFVMRKLFF